MFGDTRRSFWRKRGAPGVELAKANSGERSSTRATCFVATAGAMVRMK